MNVLHDAVDAVDASEGEDCWRYAGWDGIESVGMLGKDRKMAQARYRRLLFSPFN